MRRLLPIVTLAVTLGCPRSAPVAPVPVDAGSPAPDALATVSEVEANDTPDTAQKLTVSTRVSGAIQAVQPATRPDEDWYLIAPAQVPQDAAMVLDAPGIRGPVSLEIYDRDHNKLISQTGSGTVALPRLLVREALLVRVAAASGAAGPYTLEVRLTAPDPEAEAEPNNRAVDATPILVDHALRGTYGSEGDQDFYTLELVAAPPLTAGAAPTAGAVLVPAGASDAGIAPGEPGPPAPPTEMLRVDITGVPGIRHALTIFDDNQAPVANVLGREVGAPLSVRDFPLRPGQRRLTLLLESAPQHKKRPASNQPYALTVHRDPAPADLELEPNDTLDSATPLVPRTVVSPDQLPGTVSSASAQRIGYLSPRGDVDYYRLHLDAPGRVRVLLSALDRVDSELSLVELDPSLADHGRAVLKINEGGAKEPEVLPALTLAAGDHYLKVQAASHQVGNQWVRDQEDPDQTYTLSVTVTPDDGRCEREPNDTAAQATPIQPGQPLTGYAFPGKDVDVYKLDLSAQPVATAATLSLTGVPKVPLALEIREGRGGTLGELLNSSDPGKPGVAAQVHQKLEPGLYYLVVKPHPANRNAGTPQSDPDVAYQLSVQLE